MTKKSPSQRKELDRQLANAKRKLKLAKEDKEVLSIMNERKFRSGLYKPGKNFESRMAYQEDAEFLEAARRHDEIDSEYKMIIIDDQINMYSGDVSRLLGEVAQRD